MSGTLQAAPTATMTIASGAAGVFPTGFGYYPPEGSRVVSAQYNWTAQTGYAEDLSQLVARGVETTIQSAFLDNSTSGQTVTMTLGGSGQVVLCPPYSQGIFPLFFSGQPSFQISVAAVGTGLTRVYLLNVPCASSGIWGTTVAGAQYLPIPPELASGASTNLQTDAYGSLRENTETTEPAYSVAFPITPPATATDISFLQGSATKIIRVHQIVLSFTATAAIPSLAVSIIKRGTGNSGGTFTSHSSFIVPHDSSDAPPTVAAVTDYTVNPAGLGAVIGNIEQFWVGSTAIGIPPVVIDYGKTDKSMVLRGGSQFVCINLEGAALPAGLLVRVKYKWTEI